LNFIDFPDEFDILSVDVRLKMFLEVGRLRARYLCCYAQWQSGCARDADCVLRALFQGETTKKCKIRSSCKGRTKQIRGQSVLDCAYPMRPRERLALMVGNGH